MKETYLVQRLKKPFNAGEKWGFKDNPFAFGGGYKNGGLTDEAMDLLRDVFSFDYMGASEFEWGAVPEALHSIGENGVKYGMTSGVIDIDLEKIGGEGGGMIYVLAPTNIIEGAFEEIKNIVFDKENEYGRKKSWTLKEPTRIQSSLVPKTEWDSDVVGWLELDNGFFFFIDKEMFDRTCQLFGAENE